VHSTAKINRIFRLNFGIFSFKTKALETPPIVIYPAFPEDLKTLRELCISTFKESYAHVNTKEDMDLYVAEKFSEQVLSEELVATGTAYYMICSGNDPVGYMKLNSGKVPKTADTEGIEIERIYVSKRFQGKGYGQQLFLKAVNVALSSHVKIIWLGVWEKNLKAIKFYKRNGFVEFGAQIFTLGRDKQTDFLMKKQV